MFLIYFTPGNALKMLPKYFLSPYPFLYFLDPTCTPMCVRWVGVPIEDRAPQDRGWGKRKKGDRGLRTEQLNEAHASQNIGPQSGPGTQTGLGFGDGFGFGSRPEPAGHMVARSHQFRLGGLGPACFLFFS